MSNDSFTFYCSSEALLEILAWHGMARQVKAPDATETTASGLKGLGMSFYSVVLAQLSSEE